jgi:hypothetical protein
VRHLSVLYAWAGTHAHPMASFTLNYAFTSYLKTSVHRYNDAIGPWPALFDTECAGVNSQSEPSLVQLVSTNRLHSASGSHGHLLLPVPYPIAVDAFPCCWHNPVSHAADARRRPDRISRPARCGFWAAAGSVSSGLASPYDLWAN